MGYTCGICNIFFKNAGDYTRHINKKTTCDPIKREQIKMDKLTCHYCKRVFSGITKTNKHIEICNKRYSNMNNVIEKLVEKIEKQDKQNEILNEKLDKLMEKESKTININQQQNIINVVPFGKEKFDYITFEEYNEIFEQGFRCMQTLISLIYCNEQNPENMNVYISNFNDNSIRIFDGKDWIIEKKDYVLTNMYNSKRDFLELKFDDMYDKLSKDAKYFFKRFKAGNTDRETIDPILDELKNILYSNRNNVVKKPTKIKQLKLLEDTLINTHEKKPKKKIHVKENIYDPDYIPNQSMFF